ncbi:hypothetical protein MJD09_11425 [bacterium]|nr:hypothetical protein [bacterium]
MKYGPPDRDHEVTLGTNTTELMIWAPLADFSQDAFSFGSSSSDFVRLRDAMEFYLTTPDCELWVYSGLKTDEPVLFLFGPDDGHGSFGLRDGVEDLIPSNAFSKANLRKTGGLLPGGLLQMMYYGKLSLFDSSFEDRYSELRSAWLHAESFARQALRAGMASTAQSYISNNLMKELKGIRTHYELKDRLNPVRKYAAPTRSDFDAEINRIDLSAYGTRVLSENEPYMIIMAFEFERIFRRGQGFKFPSYDFRHQLAVRDPRMGVIERKETSPIHANSNTVVYRIPHHSNHANYTVALETFLKDDELDSGRVDQPLSACQVFFEAGPVLAADRTKLEASDLVLGIHPPKTLRDLELPFPIVPSNRFFQLETLQVYLELYHLMLDESGVGHYSLDFQVTRLEIDDEKVQRKEMVTTSFEFDTFSPTIKETFRIDISKLESGDYEMQVEIQDRLSSQKRRRARTFQILDSDSR